MSLINQALRKAQHDRTPNRMPQPGEQSPAAYAGSSTNGLSPTVVIGLIVTVAVLIGLVAGLSVVIFKGDPKPTQQVADSGPAMSAPKPKAEPRTPVTSTPVDPQITPPATAPTPTVTATPEPDVVRELRKAREAAEAQAAAQDQAAAEEAAAEAKAAARAAALPSDEIMAWLGAAKLTGVKISESGNKLILNGNAYSVGDLVNSKLQIRIMAIQETRVLFVDDNGKKYMKRL